MKYCVIYKTKKKEGLYLFVKEKDKFDSVPESLMKEFGTPQLAMVLPLNTAAEPQRVSKASLIEALETKGFYLQLPPQEQNILETHRESLGLDPQPPKKEF